MHPGEILKEEFLKPLGMSANALAKALHAATPRAPELGTCPHFEFAYAC
jgi:plasmid maintenance system antidote protein VapI